MSSATYQMSGRMKLCLPRPPLLLELDKTGWQPANLSDVVLGDIILIRHVDELDQLSMTSWNLSDVPVSWTP